MSVQGSNQTQVTCRALLHDKSLKQSNPLLDYIDKITLRLSKAQKGLREETMKQARWGWLSDASELQFLQNQCKAMQAKKVIDIGVHTGYSALCFAMALPPEGKVVALDIDDKFPQIGAPFWKEAGVFDKIDLRIGTAKHSLENMIEDGEEGTYDLAFIDADKVSYDTYYELCLKLLRPGGLIAMDNALWDGKVAFPEEYPEEKETQALDALNRKIGTDERVDVSLLTLGDGTMLAFKQ